MSLKCLSHHQSEAFIKNVLQTEPKMNFYSTPFLKYLPSGRSLHTFASYIIQQWDGRVFPQKPLFVLLNLTYSDKDDKHAMVIILFPNKDNITIAFLDPNGPITQEDKKTPPIKNVCRLLEQLMIEFRERKQEPALIDLMSGSHPLNIIGTGHCDALSLFFIYRNRGSTTLNAVNRDLQEWTQQRFTTKGLASKEIRNINKFILEKNRGQ